MDESPRRVDLRLTISAGSPYRELAGELAGKLAEYAGVPSQDKASFVESMLRSMDAASGGSRDVQLDLTVADGAVVFTAVPAAAKP
jgi:hypothetical protein